MIWKDCVGLDGYQVTSDGRVRTVDRFIRYRNRGSRWHYGIERKILINHFGYCTVYVSRHNKNYFVHQLVAKAFIPNPENKPFVNHINGIKTDNRIENLEWVTRAENEAHAKLNKLKNSMPGELNPQSVLKKFQVIDIKMSIREKIKTQAELADIYGVSRATICLINKGKLWKEVI